MLIVWFGLLAFYLFLFQRERERASMELCVHGGQEDLGGIGEGKIMIIIYYIGNVNGNMMI